MSLEIIKNDRAADFVARLVQMLESEEIVKLTGEDRDEYLEYVADMNRKATEYAKIRAEWEFMTREERIDRDPGRTARHNDFMTAIKLLIRLSNSYTDNRWADIQKEAESMERKDLGDIACYITYLIAVSNR